MKAELITPIVDSLCNVLATMAMLEVTASEAGLKTDKLPCGDVTGVVSMSSPQSSGTLAISFSEPVILSIAKGMLFEDRQEIDDVVTDLVGELTNMVAGSAKQLLDEQGYDFGLATPEVFTGKSRRVPHVANQPVYMVPMEATSGKLYVEICFSP